MFFKTFNELILNKLFLKKKKEEFFFKYNFTIINYQQYQKGRI